MLTEHTRRYGRGALALTGASRLEATPVSDAIFAGERATGALSIDFWFSPTSVRDGARIFRWRGIAFDGETPIIQRVSASVTGGRIHWHLENAILRSNGTLASAELSGRRPLVPNSWQHHRFHFEPAFGRIAYEVDGVPVDIAYLTDTGTESGSPYSIYLGTSTDGSVVIGEHVTGALDEFRIVRRAERSFDDTQNSGDPGRVVFAPIDLGTAATQITGIHVTSQQPGSTEVRAYYRIGNAVTAHSIVDALSGEWRAIPADGTLRQAVYARYLQIRVDLLADAPRTDTPRLRSIAIDYIPSPPPPPPTQIRGISIRGGVELQWNPVRTGNIAGYRVFFGEEPGRYTGAGDIMSPIDAGDRNGVQIRGLDPDVPYVFVVQSYDYQGQTGSMSREIEVRGGGAE
jgi:hypothetical protein